MYNSVTFCWLGVLSLKAYRVIHKFIYIYYSFLRCSNSALTVSSALKLIIINLSCCFISIICFKTVLPNDDDPCRPKIQKLFGIFSNFSEFFLGKSTKMFITHYTYTSLIFLTFSLLEIVTKKEVNISIQYILHITTVNYNVQYYQYNVKNILRLMHAKILILKGMLDSGLS